MRLENDEDWRLWTDGYCYIAGKKCSIWVYYSEVDNESMLKAADIKVDGVDNGAAGNFRYSCINDALKCRVSLKVTPIKNPHE